MKKYFGGVGRGKRKEALTLWGFCALNLAVVLAVVFCGVGVQKQKKQKIMLKLMLLEMNFAKKE
jgi:hypothetical protein